MHQGTWSCCEKLCSNIEKPFFEKINSQLEELETRPGVPQARQALLAFLDPPCPGWMTLVLTHVGGTEFNHTVYSSQRSSLLYPRTLIISLSSFFWQASSWSLWTSPAGAAPQALPRSAALSGPGRCSRSWPQWGSWGLCSPCSCPGHHWASPPPACSRQKQCYQAGLWPWSSHRAGSGKTNQQTQTKSQQSDIRKEIAFSQKLSKLTIWW